MKNDENENTPPILQTGNILSKSVDKETNIVNSSLTEQ